MAEQWLTVTQAAELSGYHPEHIRELLREGRIKKARKYGPLWQVDRASLLAYVKKTSELGEKRGPKTAT
jgi:excisionase family DNA binding protein